MKFKNRFFIVTPPSGGIEFAFGKYKRHISSLGESGYKRIIPYLLLTLIPTIGGFFIDIYYYDYNLYTRIAFFLFISLISFIAIIIRRRVITSKLKPKKKNIAIYQRELPSNLRPAHVRMLIKGGIIDQISLAATIIDLIDRKYFEVKRKKKDTKINLFKNGEIKLIKTDKDTSKLFKFEKFLIDWLINYYGDGYSVTNIQIREGIKGLNTSSEMFFKWQDKVFKNYPIWDYFKMVKYPIFSLEVLLFMMGFILVFYPGMSIVGQFLLMYGLGVLMFGIPSLTITQDGIDELDSWLDLKKFLKDFTNIKDKKIEMVEMLEFYLSYSVALGISGKASKEIKQFFGNEIL